jgi:hypothetical protein
MTNSAALVNAEVSELTYRGYPTSRKDFAGKALGTGVEDRLAGTLPVTALGAWPGARIFRAHDVQETRQALDMVAAIKGPDACAGCLEAGLEPGPLARISRADGGLRAKIGTQYHLYGI